MRLWCRDASISTRCYARGGGARGAHNSCPASARCAAKARASAAREPAREKALGGARPAQPCSTQCCGSRRNSARPCSTSSLGIGRRCRRVASLGAGAVTPRAALARTPTPRCTPGVTLKRTRSAGWTSSARFAHGERRCGRRVSRATSSALTRGGVRGMLRARVFASGGAARSMPAMQTRARGSLRAPLRWRKRAPRAACSAASCANGGARCEACAQCGRERACCCVERVSALARALSDAGRRTSRRAVRRARAVRVSGCRAAPSRATRRGRERRSLCVSGPRLSLRFAVSGFRSRPSVRAVTRSACSARCVHGRTRHVT